MDVTATHRVCLKCGESKPLEAFHKRKQGLHGRSSRCRACAAELYAANPGPVRESARQSHARHKAQRNKASVLRQQTPAGKARRQASRQARRAKILEAARLYREANREVIQAKNRARYRAHPEIQHAANMRREARVKRATLHVVTWQMLRDRATVFGNACAYCGGPHEHWDHVIPIARGGPHCLSNLRPACARCNLSKNDKTLREWVRLKR